MTIGEFELNREAAIDAAPGDGRGDFRSHVSG